MAQQGEGGPLTRETVASIALFMVGLGALHEAVIVLLSLDCFLREQDWEHLRKDGITIDAHFNTALLFGVRERGEKVKTGTNQGVIISDSLVAALTRVLHGATPKNETVFPLTSASFRATWWRALRMMNLEWCGPPHNLRHSGAADYVAAGYGLEQCRRRGRWLSPNSVQRYTKLHFLVRHRARLSEDVRLSGELFWSNPAASFARALKRSPARSIATGRMLSAACCSLGPIARISADGPAHSKEHRSG